MAYMIQTFDKEDGELVRSTHRAAHYEYLEGYKHLLIASGGLQDEAGERFMGSCILLDVDSLEEVQAFIAEDPFHKAGLADHVVISRWKAAFVSGDRVG